MQNRTLGIAVTAIAAFGCGCISLFTCVFGGLIVTGTPIDVTTNGITTPRTFPPTVGFVLLCLTALLILVPVVIGFFALRKRNETTM